MSNALPIVNDQTPVDSATSEIGSACRSTGAGSSGLCDSDLLRVQKPAQYLGGEHNSVLKEEAEVDLHFALAFPDAYEVGMSHLGLQILYQQINEEPKAWAERAFMPFGDMEELLRKNGAPLTSLEAKRPLAEFDILGFSLQYELCGTNILAMLELGGVTRHAADRGDEEPLVLGGGPYSYHPEVLADFFDAFFLGDAEEAIAEVIATVRAWKLRRKEGTLRSSRSDLLWDLHKLEGIYVPSLFTPEYDEERALKRIIPFDSKKPEVVRRLLPTMEGASYPRRPIVPNVSTVHNRLSLEVMRGCVRGCRFCQAGYLYRPQRERSPEEILEMIETALPATGFEELSLLSLSTADYCSIVPLLKVLMDRFGDGDGLAISFPSTRVDALKPEVLEQVQRVRRTGFTIAPEAGTQRLRDVINKGVSDEQILETCGNVFRMGWTGIKLYFMLGLPTETDEDLLGIIDIAARVKALPEARNKDITVSVSSHVPKPHTPFQWAAQITPAEIVRRQRLLLEGLKKIRVNFRYHDAFSSFLEGVFCRGDRDLSRVIERAYELGCRLDGWSEYLDEDAWSRAFLECGVDPLYYLRERDAQETLPWEHLSCGITKEYFLKEYRRALRDRTTPDCLLSSCSICGACDYDVKKNVLWPRAETEEALATAATGVEKSERRFVRVVSPEAVKRIRIQYRKQGALRFVGHLELAQLMQRAVRRAELPVAATRGFHPMPRISFGPPLQLGIESHEEFADLYLTQPIAADALEDRLNFALPQDIRVLAAHDIPLSARSLQESIAAHRFRIDWSVSPAWLSSINDSANASTAEERQAMADEALQAVINDAVVNRAAKSKRSKRQGGGHGSKNDEKVFALRDFVESGGVIFGDAERRDAIGCEVTLRVQKELASPRPLEVASSVTGLEVGDYYVTKVRTMFAEVTARNTADVQQAAGSAGVSANLDSAVATVQAELISELPERLLVEAV